MALYRYKTSINTFHKPFYGIYTDSFIHIDSRASQPYHKYLMPCYNYDWCCRYTDDDNLLVPICIDLSLYSDTDKQWFEPNSFTELKDLNIPKMTSPRFYITVIKPSRDNTKGSTGYIQEYILIPHKGIFKDKLRLWLSTSKGYDIESCYLIRYWSIHKAFYPQDYKKYCERVCIDTYREIEDTGSKRLLKEERWNVKPNYSCDPCKSHNDFLIDMKRKDEDSQDRNHNVDYITHELVYKVMDIKELNINGKVVDPNDYQLVIEYSNNEVSPYNNDNIPIGIGVKWLNNLPPLGTQYSIRCSMPIDICKLIYTPTRKENYLINI